MALGLGFGELLAGVILLIAGITGSSIGSVVRGTPDHAAGDGDGVDLGDDSITDPGAALRGQPDAPGNAATPQQAGIDSTKGTAIFEGHRVAAWIAPILTYARRHGWTGSVNSGYRTLAEQTRIYNSGVRPAAKPGTSNHESSQYPGGAVDVSNPDQLARILQGSPFAHLLVWAGAKDRVHFSHPHNGSY